MEKYLVTITGYAAFIVLIPAACVLLSLNAMKENETLKYFAKKLAIFGIIENVLNNFIEALAVMIVTSCVIPIVVLFFFVWLIKVVLGVDVNIPMRGPRKEN